MYMYIWQAKCIQPQTNLALSLYIITKYEIGYLGILVDSFTQLNCN